VHAELVGPEATMQTKIKATTTTNTAAAGMAAVQLIAGWDAAVTEPSYRFVDRSTAAAEPRCAAPNLSASGGPVAEACSGDADPANCTCWPGDPQTIARSPPNYPVFLLSVIVIMTIGGNVLVCQRSVRLAIVVIIPLVIISANLIDYYAITFDFVTYGM